MRRIEEFISISIGIFAELLRRFANILNWRFVRGLGELQILTKASYIALILVPMLTATWPAVRIVVNQHNKAVHEATVAMKTLTEKFESAIIKAAPEESQNRSNNTKEKVFEDTLKRDMQTKAHEFLSIVNNYANDYAQRALESPRFPWTLAAAFFAALSVVIGHLFYQIFAPDQVKSMTWDEFIMLKKDDYSKHPSESTLLNAKSFLQSKIGKRVESSERHEFDNMTRNLINSREDIEAEIMSMSSKQQKSLLSWIESGNSSAPPDHQNRIRNILINKAGVIGHEDVDKMSIIETGAKAEYIFHASRKPLMIILTAGLYIFGLVIIISIIKIQVISVSDAAKITSVMDILSPSL